MTLDIFQACERGDTHAVRTILDGEPSLVHATDASNRTLLTQVLQKGNVEIVRELLARNADPRVAQAVATPNEQNAEAFAIVREASLHADTRMANSQSSSRTGSAHSPTSGENANAPPANLPPPEIARLIPCKFFPNCRYGDRCMFQHPIGIALNPADGSFLPPPPGSQPMFYPGPNGMPLQPPPNPYGVPPPYMDMNPPVFQMPFGPNAAVPMYAPPVNALPNNSDSNITNSATDSQQHNASVTEDSQSSTNTTSSNIAQSTTPQTSGSAAPGSALPSNQARPANKKTAKPSRSDMNQRNRMNGGRPSCAFFARSACRYANECRFPHVLPDGTDARHLPNDQEAKLNKNPTRRTNQASDRRGSDVEAGSNGSSSVQANGKKGSGNARRSSNANNGRGKGSRRGQTTSSHANRKTVQRVPNSDEFPALPGGTTTEPPAVQQQSGKANFSTILSAPAPPKPAKTSPSNSETAAKSAAAKSPTSSSSPTAPEEQTEPLTESGNNNSQANAQAPSRDFAAVAATQPNAVAA